MSSSASAATTIGSLLLLVVLRVRLLHELVGVGFGEIDFLGLDRGIERSERLESRLRARLAEIPILRVRGAYVVEREQIHCLVAEHVLFRDCCKNLLRRRLLHPQER